MKRSILVLVIATFVSSCSHNYYVSNSLNVPLLTTKNEVHASASLGLNFDEELSGEIQAAYAITDNIAVSAAGLYHESGTKSSNTNYTQHKYFEGAVGYYKPINDFFLWEIYAGYGHNNQYHEYYDYDNPETPQLRNADLSFNKIFIQPNIGLSFRAFDIAFSTRLSHVGYYDITNNAVGVYATDVSDIMNNSSSFLFEPALTVRAGWKYVKAQLQFSRSYTLSNTYLNTTGVISLGVNISINRKYPKRITEYK